jgi:hypothetical protein
MALNTVMLNVNAECRVAIKTFDFEIQWLVVTLKHIEFQFGSLMRKPRQSQMRFWSREILKDTMRNGPKSTLK